MSRTAIVIVTYNSAEVIERCLASCLAAGAAEVLVVDNASADSTAAQVRRTAGVRLIANPENRGFAAAANQGVTATVAPLLLLLNPDGEILYGLGDLESACESPSVAAAAGLLIGEDGEPQRGFTVRRLPGAAELAFEALGLNRMCPWNPLNRRYRCLDLDLTREQDVEQPAGAFLMFRRDVWRDLSGFDESYFPVWFEDVDFCRRIVDRGLKIRLVPSARARHRGGHSFQGVSWDHRMEWWYQSLLKYASRYCNLGGRWGVGIAVLAGAALRMVAGVVSGMGSGGQFRSYVRVMTLAVSSLRMPRGAVGDERPRGRDGGTSTATEVRN